MPCTGSTSIFGMLRAALRKFSLDLGAVDDQRVLKPELAELRGQRLGLGVLRGQLVDHDDAAVLGLGRQRVLERERAHLLRQIDGVAAHDRTESTAAAAELRDARASRDGRRRCPSARTSSCRCARFRRAVLGLVRAALALGELPVDAALQDVAARLEAENLIRQISLAGFLAVEGDDFQFHHAPSFFAAAACGRSALAPSCMALRSALASDFGLRPPR